MSECGATAAEHSHQVSLGDWRWIQVHVGVSELCLASSRTSRLKTRPLLLVLLHFNSTRWPPYHCKLLELSVCSLLSVTCSTSRSLFCLHAPPHTPFLAGWAVLLCLRMLAKHGRLRLLSRGGTKVRLLSYRSKRERDG